eukprot:1429171-Pyramimonas_sp.AAC.1
MHAPACSPSIAFPDDVAIHRQLENVEFRHRRRQRPRLPFKRDIVGGRPVLPDTSLQGQPVVGNHLPRNHLEPTEHHV